MTSSTSSAKTARADATDRAMRPSWAIPTSSWSASCTRRWQRVLTVRECLLGRYVSLHGGSSFDLWRITPKAPSGSGRGGKTAVLKFYELRDNPRSTPSPD